MPIIANRTGPLDVRVVAPLTEAQREGLWAHIVRSWAQKHPEELRRMVEQGVPGKEAQSIGA